MPSFKTVDPLVQKKNMFDDCAIYSDSGHLGQVPLTVSTNFHSLFLTLMHIKFALVETVSEKKDICILCMFHILR